MSTEPRSVPYYTTEDESQWCGHIWKQRRDRGGPWGFSWEIIPPFGSESKTAGWRQTQEEAERAMADALARHAAKQEGLTP